MDEQALLDDAIAFLRRHYGGALRFDETGRMIRYVIGPDGRLVAPVMEAMLRAVDTVLFIPDYEDGAMEVQVTLKQLDEHGPAGALTDRWRIYHGEPDDVRWAVLHIDAVRYEGAVIDGEALLVANELAEEEAAVCKWINTEHVDGLRRICRVFAGVEADDPRMVGMDSQGIDVRRAFDVVRVPTTQTIIGGQSAQRVLNAMMNRARRES